MSHAIYVPGGIVHLAETNVDCPICGRLFDAAEYDLRIHNSQKGFITVKCPGCKNRVGLTMGMMTDLVCFELEDYRVRIRRREKERASSSSPEREDKP